MLGVGLTEMSLVKYLVGQLRLSEADRVDALREFAPSAVDSDWELDVAGQRVQVIRRKGAGGVLEFGTTVLAAADGSIAGLLGASPGASTAVPAMLDVLERCFPDRYPVAGSPSSRRWCRRSASSCPTSPSCSTKCGTGAPRCSSSTRQADGRARRDGSVTVAPRRSWAKDLDAADALRAAEAAGRGVRRRAGHPVSGAGRARPARRDAALLAGERRRRGHLRRCG